jgi:nucleotide-binding universal stress UspA family protein
MGTMKKLLTPIDFSPATASVLDEAARLAQALDAEVVLFHSIQPPRVTSDYGLAMENVQEINAITEKTARRQLDHAEQLLLGRDITVRTEKTLGCPTNTIVEAAREHEAAYIIMGSHGHTALYDLLVGSTTHGVLKHSPCPVIIVPPSKNEG